MGLLGNSLPLRDVYLKVSDDKGQFFDNVTLEKKMINFLGQSKKLVKTLSAEAMKKLLSELIAVSNAYNRQINLATSVSNGILVKHRSGLAICFCTKRNC